MSATSERHPRPNIRNSLLEMFHKRTGQTIYIADLVRELGFTEKQIRQGINNISSDIGRGVINGDITIETVIRGKAYTARRVTPSADPAPTKPPTDVLFRLMGTRKNGNMVLERDDGTLWEATEL